LIEELRKGQTGPVHLLDHISKSLPESMWLTDLKQAAGEITLEGRCTSLNALSDFVSALEASNLFERPVEIIDSRVEPATAATPELIRFSVKARQLAKAAD
jgi:type IV pilus assembly protein PilN